MTDSAWENAAWIMDLSSTLLYPSSGAKSPSLYLTLSSCLQLRATSSCGNWEAFKYTRNTLSIVNQIKKNPRILQFFFEFLKFWGDLEFI